METILFAVASGRNASAHDLQSLESISNIPVGSIDSQIGGNADEIRRDFRSSRNERTNDGSPFAASHLCGNLPPAFYTIRLTNVFVSSARTSIFGLRESATPTGGSFRTWRNESVFKPELILELENYMTDPYDLLIR